MDFGRLPMSGSYLISPSQLPPVWRHRLWYCQACGLVHRELPVGDEAFEYTSQIRSTAGQMPDYAPELAESLVRLGVGGDKLIVDIGGNDGAFLTLLEQAGFSQRLNVEPGRALAEISQRAGHPTECCYFGPETARRMLQKHGPAGAVVCRHVMEHLEHPEDLLAGAKELLSPDGLLLLETPDAEETLQNLVVHELWDQHLFHFADIHLRAMLAAHGWQTLETDSRYHRGGRNLLVWARKPSQEVRPLAEVTGSQVEACRTFRSRWQTLSADVRRAFQGWKPPIALLGASHPQINFCLFTGAGPWVDLLVDDDQAKCGLWAPLPNPTPIVSTAQLLDGPPPATIVFSAFGCDSWIQRVRQELEPKGVACREPYPFQDHVRPNN